MELANEIFQWIAIIAALYMGIGQGFGMHDMQRDLDELTFRQEGKQGDGEEVQSDEPQARKDPIKLEISSVGGVGGAVIGSDGKSFTK